ncbi:MAG: glycosyltransferase family 2 protein [Chloroflexi bacterium]|nr:glycosyltransferase family 2 protein [Chloroflexota bacterium]
MDRDFTPILLLGGLTLAAGRNLARRRRDRPAAEALRRARQQPLPEPAGTPRVSILVAAWNEAPILARHLESVQALQYPTLEYVLCAGGSDGTFALAKRYRRPGFILLRQQPGEGKQRALRRCFQRASGDIVYLTDADCLLDDLSFQRTLAPLLQGEAQAATGGSRPLPEQWSASLLPRFRWAADIYAWASGPRDSAGLLGRNAAITRQALERAGGFAAPAPTGTDYHLAKTLERTGVLVRQVHASEVASHYPEDISAYVRQQRRWLRNVALHGGSFGARQEAWTALRTSLLGLAMLLAPLAALWAGPWLLALWVAAVAHSALSKLRYLAFAYRVSPTLDRRVTATEAAAAVPFTLLEFAAWAAPLWDYLSARRRTSW